MTANPTVKVGDRIVAQDVAVGHRTECRGVIGQTGIVKYVSDDMLEGRFQTADGVPPVCSSVTSWRLADAKPHRPSKGHRVRVVLEGEVSADPLPGNPCFCLGGSVIHPEPSDGVTVSIERLPEPEPEWQPGDVVRAANGVLWCRSEYNPRGWEQMTGRPRNSSAAWSADDSGAIARPLTLLVRDGKPVDGAS